MAGAAAGRAMAWGLQPSNGGGQVPAGGRPPPLPGIVQISPLETMRSLPWVLRTGSFGKSGRVLPRLGLGAFPLGNLPNERDGVEVALHAMRAGVRYIDTAPSYGAGRSETRVGIALAEFLAAAARRGEAHGAEGRSGGTPGAGEIRTADGPDGPNAPVTRADFYIATKTLRRDAAGAREELEQSLKRLKLEYVDAVQVHEVHDDVGRLFEKDSVLDALRKAQDEGLVKFVGVTGHRNPKWLVEAITRNPPTQDGDKVRGFVSALVPVNPIDVQHFSFVKDFLPKAAELNVAVVAMKVYGGGYLLGLTNEDGSKKLAAGELLRYALAQKGVAVAVPGCDKVEHVDEALAGAGADEMPLAETRQRELEALAGEHLGKKSEWYKDE